MNRKSKIIVDCAISLDGFFAGENRSPQNPMGGVSPKIHAWMFHEKAFWEHLQRDGGITDGPDGKLIRQTIQRTGAYVMGKRMFEEGEAVWPDNLFKANVYILTHEVRDPWVQEGGTTFYFVNDGIEPALDLALEAAQGKDVRIQGGAHTIQQYLNAGLVGECFLHIAPVFLGRGLRLFESMNPEQYNLHIEEVIPSALTTHVRYALRKK